MRNNDFKICRSESFNGSGQLAGCAPAGGGGERLLLGYDIRKKGVCPLLYIKKKRTHTAFSRTMFLAKTFSPRNE